jgi:DNA uptake protein ComE-like DNA-binding protein
MTTRNFLLLLAAALVPGLRAAKRDLVDINSASIEELTMLPGIQQAKAQAIVKNRPYLNKAELLSRKILSAAEYRRIRDLIIARR